MSIPEANLRNCLALLEPHATHADTPSLHDPLYALLRGDEGGNESLLTAALSSGSLHPAAAAIRDELAPFVDVEAPGMLSTLLRFGPVGDPSDLVGEVARRLERAASDRRVLGQRIESLESGLDASSRSANAVAALGAFALLFALLGWAVALGWMDVNWMDPPRVGAQEGSEVR